MKKRITKILQISAMILMLTSLGFSYDDGKYYCHSRYAEGNVYIQRANDAEISELTRNMPIMAGDRIWTEDGRAEIQFNDGSIINLDAGTKLDFEAIGDPIGRYEDSTLIKLWAGSIYATIFHDRDSSQNLQVQTMAGSISLLNRGSYRIDLGDDYSLRLTVFDGLAEVGNNRNTAMVRSGQRLFLEPGDQMMDPVDFADAEMDEFSEWVMQRTSRFSQTKSVQYVDDTLDYLVDEMDDYGDWRYSNDYDTYIWIPRSTYIYDDWSPYYNGQWVWTPHGWTFVSYDPWGWTPYRYGRWDWSPWGWCWIPGYRYSPSWVYWEIGYDYIGWAPIGYYNYPSRRYAWKDYPRGFKPRNGHHDVDIHDLKVVHKSKFGKESISKIAISKADLSKINRKSAKTISADFAEKGFSDKKINYTAVKSNVKNPVFKDLPEGAYNRLIKKNTSTGSTYGWSSNKQKSPSEGTYKKTETGKSVGKYIYKSNGTQYYKKDSSKSSSSKSSTSKDKSSYSRSRESSSSSSSSSSSKSSPTKSSSGSSSTSSPVKKKGDSAYLSSGRNEQNNSKWAYLYTVRDATTSQNEGGSKSVTPEYSKKSWNSQKTKSYASSTWNNEKTRNSYYGNTSKEDDYSPNATASQYNQTKNSKWKYLFTERGRTYSKDYNDDSNNYRSYQKNSYSDRSSSYSNSDRDNDYRREDTSHSNSYYGGYQSKSSKSSSSSSYNLYSKSNDKPAAKHESTSHQHYSAPSSTTHYSNSSSSSSKYGAPSSNHGNSSISVKKKN